MYNYEEIKQQVDAVLRHATRLDVIAPLDEIMSKWQSAKKPFIDMLGGNLIWESPDVVTFTLSETEKESHIQAFLSSLDGDWRLASSNIIKLLEANAATFYDNQIVDTCGDERLTKGMKITKVFKYFMDEAMANSYQIEMSRILQLNKVHGKLCFSAHPLDYLSSSENASNWRSCHSLDGEYASGNLSYMMDKSTILCYLKSEDGDIYHLPHFPQSVPWNNKKWRTLVNVNEDFSAIMISRQYPFFTNEGQKMIKDYWGKISGVYFGPWDDFVFSSVEDKDNHMMHSLRGKYMIVRGRPVALTDLVRQHEDGTNFNDLLYSSVTGPKIAYDNWCFGDSVLKPFYVGAPVPCLKCGGSLLDPEQGGFICGDCIEPVYYCDICGASIYDGEEWHKVDNRIVCECCWDEYVSYCDNCGRYVIDDDMENGMCKQCNEEAKEEEDYGG